MSSLPVAAVRLQQALVKEKGFIIQKSVVVEVFKFKISPYRNLARSMLDKPGRTDKKGNEAGHLTPTVATLALVIHMATLSLMVTAVRVELTNAKYHHSGLARHCKRAHTAI